MGIEYNCGKTSKQNKKKAFEYLLKEKKKALMSWNVYRRKKFQKRALPKKPKMQPTIDTEKKSRKNQK